MQKNVHNSKLDKGLRGTVPKMSLLFGVHNHQPVGNFEHIFKQANNDCYHPFIETLYNYPEIKSTIHFSGSLIDWLLEHDPALLAKVKNMVKRDQVEILTGGYYEPILPIIPERDRLGQINMLSNFIRDYFEYEPMGAWIGERVWDPRLSKSLIQAKVKYILLDAFHLHRAGIKAENLLGYYVIKEQGLNLAVFPINKRLRYSIPFSAPNQCLAYLKDLASKLEEIAVTIVDDGEKFGLWPGTHKWVYHERWLEKFFQSLIKNKDWLKTQTIGEYMQENKPKGSCHLPSASYEEMMSWSGGSFTNFFLKYPEANNLHKRMLYVSEKVAQENQNQLARSYLYKGQCNCPYWHGVFGGIYLGHLRHIAYQNIITAQSLLHKEEKSAYAETEAFNVNYDSTDELIISNPLLNVFVAPQQGGGIFELDYLPKCINLMDGMTRRPEHYHEKIYGRRKKIFRLKKDTPVTIHDLLGSKEKGLEHFLIYDSYRRMSLLDHFLSCDLTLPEFKKANYQELGDFVQARYALKKSKDAKGISVILKRLGMISCSGEQVPLVINKELHLNNQDAQILIGYFLEDPEHRPLDLVFAVEFNLAPEGQGATNKLRCLGKFGEDLFSLMEDVQIDDIHELRVQDGVNSLETVLTFEQNPNLWCYPLETISASEAGFERNYQQTVILVRWPIRLEKSWQVNLKLGIAPI